MVPVLAPADETMSGPGVGSTDDASASVAPDAASTSSAAATVEPLIAQLRRLFTDISEATAVGTDTTIHRHKVAQVFARLRSAYRTIHLSTRHQKQLSSEAKSMLDAQHLQLQNLQYERMHLLREIKNTVYQTIDMVPEANYESNAPPELLSDDPHKRMLGRLQYELMERKRLHTEDRALAKAKDEAIRATQAKRREVDKLSDKLEAIIKSTTDLRKRLSIPTVEARERNDQARNLPLPLFNLYSLLLNYTSINPQDASVELRGDFTCAQTVLSTMKATEKAAATAAAGASASPAPALLSRPGSPSREHSAPEKVSMKRNTMDMDEDSTHVRKKARTRTDEEEDEDEDDIGRSRPQTTVFPLEVIFSIRDRSESTASSGSGGVNSNKCPVASLTFRYMVALDVVTCSAQFYAPTQQQGALIGVASISALIGNGAAPAVLAHPCGYENLLAGIFRDPDDLGDEVDGTILNPTTGFAYAFLQPMTGISRLVRASSAQVSVGSLVDGVRSRMRAVWALAVLLDAAGRQGKLRCALLKQPARVAELIARMNIMFRLGVGDAGSNSAQDNLGTGSTTGDVVTLVATRQGGGGDARKMRITLRVPKAYPADECVVVASSSSGSDEAAGARNEGTRAENERLLAAAKQACEQCGGTAAFYREWAAGWAIVAVLREWMEKMEEQK